MRNLWRMRQPCERSFILSLTNSTAIGRHRSLECLTLVSPATPSRSCCPPSKNLVPTNLETLRGITLLRESLRPGGGLGKNPHRRHGPANSCRSRTAVVIGPCDPWHLPRRWMRPTRRDATDTPRAQAWRKVLSTPATIARATTPPRCQHPLGRMLSVFQSG